MLIVSRSVVTAAIVDLYSGEIDFHSDMPIASVPGWIAAAVPKQIVGRGILLNSFEDLSEIVRIEERATSGVAGERYQCFLRRKVRVQGVDHRLTGVWRGSTQACVLGFSAGDKSLQSTKVHRIDGHVRPDGSIDGRPKFGLVLDSCAVHAAGEINQRFLLLQV